MLAATALTISLHAWLQQYSVARAAGVAGLVEAFLIALWAFGGGGHLWPMWPALGLAIALAVFAFAMRRGRLEHRIEVLETTRAGAVDVQETELRRIERDLHDGAQARLVALGMNLGFAEQKLAVDPEAARDLVIEARADSSSRARPQWGVNPPVLTDRGHEAAVAALAHASVVPVIVEADVPERPPAVVETAAYFVIAEAVANAAKHAEATRIDVRITRRPERLAVEVSDDGRGGADELGSGLGGLRRRVEALDGTLVLASPSGGGTTLRAELPCAS